MKIESVCDSYNHYTLNLKSEYNIALPRHLLAVLHTVHTETCYTGIPQCVSVNSKKNKE